MTTKATLDMSNMIVCNEQIELLVGKAQKPNSTYKYEIGQEVILTTAIAAGDTEIQVEPLKENIKEGTILDFKDNAGTSLGTVTVTIPPDRGDKTIEIAAAAAGVANYSVAVTDGIEQVLTVGTDVTAGDRSIALGSALTDWVEEGRIISFSNGVEVVVKSRTETGATALSIEPAPFPIPAGETAELKNYLPVYSINQVDDSASANTLAERNYRSGSGTGKAVTSYNYTVSIGGNYIKNDFALFRLFNNVQDPTLRGYTNYCYIIEPEGGQDLEGTMWLGQHGNQRPNDQTKKISATLEVDGILGNTLVPRSVLY